MQVNEIFGWGDKESKKPKTIGPNEQRTLSKGTELLGLQQKMAMKALENQDGKEYLAKLEEMFNTIQKIYGYIDTMD